MHRVLRKDAEKRGDWEKICKIGDWKNEEICWTVGSNYDQSYNRKLLEFIRRNFKFQKFELEVLEIKRSSNV